MSLNPCILTGRPVRLGANKLTIGRQKGITHYIAYLDNGKMPYGYWTCAELKPYHSEPDKREWKKLCTRWNLANPAP